MSPAESAYTVSIEGPERWDGEKGYLYVLDAPSLDQAMEIAWAYHVATNEHRLDEDGCWSALVVPDVRVVADETFAGTPPWPQDTPGRYWADMQGPDASAEVFMEILDDMARFLDAQRLGRHVGRIRRRAEFCLRAL